MTVAAGGAGSAEASAEETGKRGFRYLWKKYGLIGVGTYLGVYVLTLGGMYLAVSAGVVKTGDINSLVEKLHLDKLFGKEELNIPPKAGNFMIAWVATKLTEPVRLIITLAITPPISRLIRPGLYAAQAAKAAKVASKV